MTQPDQDDATLADLRFGRLLDRFAGLWDALASDDFERARGFLAPDFRHRIVKQLNWADLDVEGFIDNIRVWKGLAGSIEEERGELLAATEAAAVYRRDLHGTSDDGVKTTWSALVVVVARGNQLTHYEEFEPEDRNRALARFSELTADTRS
ncbi:MAG: hypothetical protein AAF480_00040 [Actinomycetota bacterium]